MFELAAKTCQFAGREELGHGYSRPATVLVEESCLTARARHLRVEDRAWMLEGKHDELHEQPRDVFRDAKGAHETLDDILAARGVVQELGGGVLHQVDGLRDHRGGNSATKGLQ